MEFVPVDIDPNETLLHNLFNLPWEIAQDQTIEDFRTSLAGRLVLLKGSHITRRSGGGIMGAMLGVKSEVVEDRWEFEVKIAAQPNQRFIYDGCITFRTGQFGQVIDELLRDLFLHVDSCVREQNVLKILNDLKK